MNEDQITEFVMETTKDIAELRGSTKSAHKRLNKMDEMISGIHELAQNVGIMAAKIEDMTEHVSASIERIESGQKSQGERIGNIEHAILTIERNEQEIAKLAQRVDAIEKEPAGKWKDLTKHLIMLTTAVVFGVLIEKIF